MQKVVDILTRQGRDIWNAAYRGERSVEALLERLKALPRVSNEIRDNPGGVLMQYIWPTLWYEHGLQRFEIGAKFAASLVCTAVRAEDVEVRMPFPAFMIQLPDGVFESGGQPISFLTLLHYEDAVHVGCFGGSSTVFMIKCGAKGGSLNGLVRSASPETIEASLSEMDRSWRDTTGIHERAREAISQVIFGVCAHLQGGGAGAPLEQLPTRARTNERGDPVARTYRLYPVVHSDCRDYVRGYLRGERSSVPHVRTLVMGHYRNQPHGPGRSERKVIWIQPHWRGPEDAPLAVRPHRVD